MSQTFEEANQVMHPVETEWHYLHMTQAGFEAKTKVRKGFVRSYDYVHPSGHTLTVCTGVNADYWRDTTTGETGYWKELVPHLQKIVKRPS